MILSPNGSAVPSGTQRCPKCADGSVKAATLTERYVYLRCAACGEVWVIPERRQIRRPSIPSQR